MDEELAEHWEWLENYAQAHMAGANGDVMPLELKLVHTREVFAHASAIAQAECRSPHARRAAMLAALYHDVARFPQYCAYHTFKDADSRNHGAWSAIILKRAGRLARESAVVRRLAQQAVCLHNRYALPESLTPEARKVCSVVRDADKIDIARVMATHLEHKPYNPTIVLGLPDNGASNPEVRKAVTAGRTVSYAELRSVNDFRLLVGAWIFDLGSGAARRRYVEAGQAERVLADLPRGGVYDEAVAVLRDAFKKALEEEPVQ